MSLETKIDNLTDVIKQLIVELKKDGKEPDEISEPETKPVAKKPVAKKKTAATKKPEPAANKDSALPSVKEVRDRLVAYSSKVGRDPMLDLLTNVVGTDVLPDVDPSRYPDIIEALNEAEQEMSEAA